MREEDAREADGGGAQGPRRPTAGCQRWVAATGEESETDLRTCDGSDALERGNVAPNRTGLTFKHQFNGHGAAHRLDHGRSAPVQYAITVGYRFGFTTTLAGGSLTDEIDDIELNACASDASQRQPGTWHLPP